MGIEDLAKRLNCIPDIRADDAVEKFGADLVGMEVLTEPYGDWPGGRCKVTEIQPDDGATEIVFQVELLETGDDIGVFDHEFVTVFLEGPADAATD